MNETREGLESSEAPLLTHLTELRNRLIYCLWIVLVAFGLCYLVADPIFHWLTVPLEKAYAMHGTPAPKLIYTELAEGFITKVKVAFFASLAVSFPLIAVQIWKFVAPGLYRNEKKAFLPFLAATPVLFITGGALAYYLLLPNAFYFFISFDDFGRIGGEAAVAVQSLPKLSEYLSFIMLILLAFGLCFQLPVLLVLLARVGILSASGLRKARRYSVVGVFTLAAFATPPDVTSQFMLAIPMLGLYEISILIISAMEKRRAVEADA